MESNLSLQTDNADICSCRVCIQKRLCIPETSLHGSRHVLSIQRTSDPGRLARNDMHKKQNLADNSLKFRINQDSVK
jgi:hypothetical protein